MSVRSLWLLKLEQPILGICLCLAVLPFSIGCSGNKENQSSIVGEVTLNGEPLQQGSILFTPLAGTKGVVVGGPIEEGRYQISTIKGPSQGKHRVEIRSLRMSGKMVQKALAPQGEMVEGREEAIPPRFNSASTLEVKVKPGENVCNFELTSN